MRGVKSIQMNKLQTNGRYAILLNEVFQKLNLPGNSDLDVIATYLAFQIHYAFIRIEDVDHLKKLVIQIADKIKEFDEPESFQKI